jgi:hypothetical protein
MSDTHITFRKAVTGAVSGLAGFVVGGFVVKAAVHYFAGSPAWELPATFCGALTLFVVAILTIAPALRGKTAKHR